VLYRQTYLELHLSLRRALSQLQLINDALAEVESVLTSENPSDEE
jgi:hypothetical protein